MTPCEKRGYKVGDRFRVIRPDNQEEFSIGSIVELSYDDGSSCPKFDLIEGSCRYEDGVNTKKGAYTSLDYVEPLKETNMTLEDAYLTLHNACGIEVGDTVKVLRKAETDEMGWNNSWTTSMNKSIGKEFKVLRDANKRGFEISDSFGLSYPFFVLELVKKAEKPIKAGDYDVEFNDNGSIKVGYQTVSFKVIKAIYKKAKEKKNG